MPTPVSEPTLLIDGSCLIDPRPTGVTMAAFELLKTRGILNGMQPKIVSCSFNDVDAPRIRALNAPWIHKRVPSKLIHALCASGLSSFDRLFGPADYLLLPNLNIVGIPKIPYALLVHDLSYLIHPWWFSRKTRLWHWLARPKTLMKKADRLFAVSEWTKQELVNYLDIPPEKITVVDVPSTLPSKAVTPRPITAPYFLLMSAQDIRKNAEIAVIAFLAFVKTHPEWKLVLVGKKGPSAHPNILHRPYLPAEERNGWIRHAAALLYPSWYEGLGLPPREALELGTPCLASGIGSTASTAPEGIRFLPHHRPESWLDAMESVANGQERLTPPAEGLY